MEMLGRVRDGVVVLDHGTTLPEGTAVTVVYPARAGAATVAGSDRSGRVRLPLVPSSRPGSRRLTADLVADLLDDANDPA